jgi:hypothetical protein
MKFIELAQDQIKSRAHNMMPMSDATLRRLTNGTKRCRISILRLQNSQCAGIHTAGARAVLMCPTRSASVSSKEREICALNFNA